jgi:diguanylate cyclase
MTVSPDTAMLVSTVGLMAVLAIAFGQTYRVLHNRFARAVLLGWAFGVAAVYTAANHEAQLGTTLADPSATFVGFAAAFLAVPGALAALLVALVGWHLLSPAPHWSDLLQLFLASGVGAMWSYLVRGSDRRDLQGLLMLGALQTSVLLPAYLWPADPSLSVPGATILSFLTLNLVIAVLVGSFIERERTMIHAEQQLRLQANTDQLTGLQNRRTIEAAFASRSVGQVGQSLMVIDIDNFKSINDAHGHVSGDAVLRHIARCLVASVRTGDLVVRLGGEEFAVLLAASSLEEAVSAAERLRISVERNRVRIDQLAVPVTVSIGVAWWRGSADFAEQFRIADSALYDAKRQGRNRVRTRLEGFESGSAAPVRPSTGRY